MIELNRTWTAKKNLLTILILISISLIVQFTLYSPMIQGTTASTSSSSGNPANTTKLISPNNTNVNRTNFSSFNVTSAPGQLLTYTNSTNNLKFEYPSTWAIDAGYNENGTNIIVADVFPNISLDNTSSTNAFVHIDRTFINSHLNPEIYVHRIISGLRQVNEHFQLISSIINNTIGEPGFEIQSISVPPNSNSSMDSMRIGKFFGNQVYYISFSTPYLGSNSDLFIKQAKVIGDSLRVLNTTK